ncbi:hypothetical protein DLAC_01173 [Tieghemostelium lacteum]|uniref:RING-type domain-containing protein n=1 Tax=Tieghemostelium lacteum TaxID=361077 RepID=A0A152A7Y2_TIELA|nr:hypothetical protein DLAC_01173 [Tieghemostelium lacteum]|eukprot:KYR02343.1 hypothetical protein DLAC_01173 [Tieghemostelium lacteum]
MINNHNSNGSTIAVAGSQSNSPVFSSYSTTTSNVSTDHGNEISDINLYVSPPSSSLLCPLHNGLFNQPLIAKCGHTFCKYCLHKQQSNNTDRNKQSQFECPFDKTLLSMDADFFPNLALSTQINDLMIYCKHGIKRNHTGEWVQDEQGCQMKIRLGSRFEHDRICDYATIQCPYNKTCPPLKRHQLKQHTLICNHINCPHKSAGCMFEGTKQQLDEHLLGCVYESIKDYISRNEEQITILRTQLDEKHTENDFLKKSILQLTARFDQLALKLEAKTNKFEGTLKHIQASLEATQSQLSETTMDLVMLKKNANLEAIEIVDLKIPQLKCKGTFTGHNGPIWCMTVTNGFLISGSSDQMVKIWDLTTLKCKAMLAGHQGIVHCLAVIGNRLFSGSSDQTIRVWDLETFECLEVLTDHDNTVCALAIAAGYLFSGSYQIIKVYDLESLKCVETLKGNNHWVRALTVSGGYLYTGAHNMVKIWDLGNFECVHTMTGGSGSIYSLAVAGRKLLAGTYENSIVAWDLDTFDVISKLDGHIGAVYTLAVYGQRFFSGSYDSTIKVWNTDSLICVQTLNRHTSSVESLVVHSGCLFSGSADNSIKVWR